MINKLYLIRGLPGSGKSTEAKRITDKNSGLFKHLEADMYFMQGGKYNFDPSKLRYAHEWCQTKTESYLERGYNVIVSNTFTTLKEIKPYEDIAKKLNVKLEVYQTNNTFKNVHNVPEEALQRMKDRWQEYPGTIQIPPVKH